MYYLLFLCCYAFSLLPFRVLYLISDLLYLLVYHVAGYRKKVVMANLAQAFPEKTAAERKRIAEKYYRNLTDAAVETVKLMSIRKKALESRFRCDLSLLHRLYREGRACQIHLGHHFNWEWANLYLRIGTDPQQPFLVTYMPLHSKASDRLFSYIRSRFGSTMVPADDVLRAMQPWQGKPYASVLVADQNPGKVRRAYWFPFMHKMTAFYKGPELSARRNDNTVIFGHIRKVKRGYYQAFTDLAEEHAQQTGEGDITAAFVEYLEKNIRDQPENWVWSHRRWKREWPGNTATAKP
ncbi:lysophospholipid acyltransferase family protein [Compostibacter hankyongensis]|uniref:Lysophospholipid acyltransferase family protein n=1 Tax=Compostibacter hankyongensis TaxID=1007089 RepID=A0ABP8FDN2_9BACT